jgi:hypothetical protein
VQLLVLATATAAYDAAPSMSMLLLHTLAAAQAAGAGVYAGAVNNAGRFTGTVIAFDRIPLFGSPGNLVNFELGLAR